MYKPTRYYSSKQEKNVAKTLGGSIVPNSGAIKYGAGDVQLDNILVECKTCTTQKKSFSIKQEWLDKNSEEAFSVGKQYSVLAFNFGPDTNNYYVLDEKTFRKFVEFLSNED